MHCIEERELPNAISRIVFVDSCFYDALQFWGRPQIVIITAILYYVCITTILPLSRIELASRIIPDHGMARHHGHLVKIFIQIWLTIRSRQIHQAGSRPISIRGCHVIFIQENLNIKQVLQGILSGVNAFDGPHRRAFYIGQTYRTKALHVDCISVYYPQDNSRRLNGGGDRQGGQRSAEELEILI